MHNRAHPLVPVKCEFSEKVRLKESATRKWQIAITAILNAQNGTLRDAVMLWKRNVDQHLQGIEEVCFSFPCFVFSFVLFISFFLFVASPSPVHAFHSFFLFVALVVRCMDIPRLGWTTSFPMVRCVACSVQSAISWWRTQRTRCLTWRVEHGMQMNPAECPLFGGFAFINLRPLSLLVLRVLCV